MNLSQISLAAFLTFTISFLVWFFPPFIEWRRKRREALEALRLAALPVRCAHGLRKAEWCTQCDGKDKEPHVEANCGPCACADCKPTVDNRYDCNPSAPRDRNIYYSAKGVNDAMLEQRFPTLLPNAPSPAFKVRGEPVDFVGPVNALADKLGMQMDSIDTTYMNDHTDQVELRIRLIGSARQIADVVRKPVPVGPTKFSAEEFRADLRWLLDKWKGEFVPTSDPSMYQNSNQFCWFGSIRLRLDHAKPTGEEMERATRKQVANDWDFLRRNT